MHKSPRYEISRNPYYEKPSNYERRKIEKKLRRLTKEQLQSGMGGIPLTKSDCKYYNWNDNPDYPSYPKEYGARCELFKIFFRQSNGKLLPDCEGCREYEILRHQSLETDQA